MNRRGRRAEPGRSREERDRAATGAGYPFAIVRSRDRRPVGAIGLRLRDLPEGRASIGYWMVASGRGQGVTRAALRTVTGWALRDLGVSRLQLFIEPWNTRLRPDRRGRRLPARGAPARLAAGGRPTP